MLRLLIKSGITILTAFFILSSPIVFSQDDDSLHHEVDTIVQHDEDSLHAVDLHQDAHEMHGNHDEHMDANEHEEHAAHEEHHGADFAPILFVILALIIGAATRFFLSRFNIPFTVALLIIGIALGYLGRTDFFVDLDLGFAVVDASMFDRSFSWASSLDAHTILTVFLPILIFEAAFAMDVHTFKKSFINSLLLAVPGILMALFATAGLMWIFNITGVGLNDWTWPMVVLFGTVISATDPVAVVAILKELGASKKLGTLIEGESLMNDGTAIVIFNVILIGISGGPGAEDGLHPLLEFFRVSFGGVAIGAIFGVIGLWWMRKVFNDMLIEITIIVALAFLTFFVCEHGFGHGNGVSGVLGLVTLGLILSGPGRTKISPEVQHFIHEFWEFTAFTANTLIFLIVGVVIAERTHFKVEDLWILLAIYLIIHLVRGAVILALLPIMKRAGYGIGKNHAPAMWWGALRGAIGLALALIVESSPAFPQVVREEFLFFTAGIVCMTLLINATSMKWVANKLGLTSVSKTKKYVQDSAKDFVFNETVATIDDLEKDRFFRKVNWEAVGSYLPPGKEHDLEGIDNFKEEARRRVLEKEKSSYWAQFKEGLISPSAYNLLVSEINEIIDSGGEKSLADRGDLDTLLDTKNSLKRFGFLANFFSRRYVERLAASFDAAKGFYTATQGGLKMLKELQAAAASDEETAILKEIEAELEENNIQALTFLRNFKNQYPNIYRHVSTRQAIRTLLNTEKAKINDLVKAGRITSEEASLMIAEIEVRMKNLTRERMSHEEQHREAPKEKL